MSKTEEICGKCLYHRKRNEEWICTNPESEYYGCYTEYRDCCDTEFEERQASKDNFSIEIVRNKKF